MEKQQTAVEWLVNEMPVIDWADPYWKVKLEKAKEMEKEQIIDAYIDGYSAESWNADSEQYYNEIYKQEE
jgi:hypothetical protein